MRICTAMIPLYTVYMTTGETFSRIVVNAHILSGDDVNSKVGTKKAALLSEPIKYLLAFGEHETHTEHEMAQLKNFSFECGVGYAQKSALGPLMPFDMKST